MIKENKIQVTQPDLPDLKEFIPYLEEIWKSKWVTNNGIFHQRLELELAEFLGVEYVSLFSNGTLALITALQVLNITGEVITTPYSFVATTNALIWNKLKPIFVDIEPEYCNINVAKIEAAITSKTSAILPVHVYGNPCNVEIIQKIAKKNNLKVIYDAAHAFGNNYKGESILKYGDLSILSFHATKVFNTLEGGAIISHDKNTKIKIDQLKNFGYVNETTVVAPGINSKMNELQAAMGILQLKDYHKNIQKRTQRANAYRTGLNEINGIRVLKEYPGLENYNHGYFPIFINDTIYGASRDELYLYLQKNEIFGRRYFYPLISQFPFYQNNSSVKDGNLLIAEKISKEVICLPLYSDLEYETITKILYLIKQFAK